ncbi:disulfide bond formation protein DsbB [Rhodothalassium salexigens DSM 2132]|uniref:Disulfide bond formation protein DsbB n=1 Tax=Rhodothalassium salexigens DSM 2132 TaxID=1188247 RepID=A0A4R2PLA0_RHOSA|nr:disulfide bond formation protein B [Rhodothalassium salexigens]MBB4210972.1 disulfide bond formation protein DsbB [Rhodothalassium salexigens DSM 2132]MBK1638703.1 hypothetical protein [Rhodothalassium salexigens DSM 2132]TCP36370.1 disulfide bond formation protein DsbB [Rhodothalassium salexigens DSM 2132]
MTRLVSFFRTYPLGVLLALIAATIVAVMVMEHGFGYAPCKMCYWQRWAVYAAGGVALVGLVTGRVGAALPAIAGLFLVGGGIGFYQMGLETGWWPGPSSCTGSSLSDDIDAVIANLNAAPVISCDDAALTLFGWSLAAYNVVWSAMLAALTLWLWRAWR